MVIIIISIIIIIIIIITCNLFAVANNAKILSLL